MDLNETLLRTDGSGPTGATVQASFRKSADGAGAVADACAMPTTRKAGGGGALVAGAAEKSSGGRASAIASRKARHSDGKRSASAGARPLTISRSARPRRAG